MKIARGEDCAGQETRTTADREVGGTVWMTTRVEFDGAGLLVRVPVRLVTNPECGDAV